MLTLASHESFLGLSEIQWLAASAIGTIVAAVATLAAVRVALKSKQEDIRLKIVMVDGGFKIIIINWEPATLRVDIFWSLPLIDDLAGGHWIINTGESEVISFSNYYPRQMCFEDMKWHLGKYSPFEADIACIFSHLRIRTRKHTDILVKIPLRIRFMLLKDLNVFRQHHFKNNITRE